MTKKAKWLFAATALAGVATGTLAVSCSNPAGLSSSGANSATSARPPQLGIPEYMSPELRQRVERLKLSAAQSPTTPETADERALILFDWANAYALTGRFIPVNLTMLVSIMTRPGDPSRAQMKDLDQYITELTIYEEQPEALGATAIANTGPFTVGSMQTITQVYTVGERAIPTGGGFVLGQHFMSNQGRYQTSDPAGANYVSAASSNPAISIEPSTRPVAGMFGGFRGARAAISFEVTGGELQPGDTVTFTVGDTSGGGPGFEMQSYANNGLRFPTYVAYEPSGYHFSLPPILIETAGAETTRVKGFAPSIARPDETVEISVRSEDFARNRATGPIPAYEVLVNGQRHGEIPAGDDAITLYPIAFETEGVQRVSFRSPDGAVVGEANPILVTNDEGRNIYWGETHAHSAFAEGQGTVDGFYTFGRDDARLDFLGMSEHDVWLDDFEFEQLRDATRRYMDPGKFITYLSYEWTAPTFLGGHHNVFYRTPDDRERSGIQFAPTLPALYQHLRANNDPDDVVIIPHAHQTGEYRVNDGEMETVIEIMSLHGVFEWFGQRYLDQGHEVGFIAASDDHLSHPGYATALSGSSNLSNRSGLAAVVAPEKSQDAIFDGLKSRSTYATSGERIILDLDVSGGRMGQRIELPESADISLQAIGTAPLDRISIVKNGEEVYTKDFLLDATGNSRTVAISFRSETDPKVRENARGWRFWRGALKVDGARIVDFSAPGIDGLLHSSVARGDGSNELLLDVRTRGYDNTIFLELDRNARAATISLDLNASRETGTPLVISEPHRYPAMEIILPLRDMNDGLLSRALPGPIYDDHVFVRTISNARPLEATIEWTDPEDPQPDDNYFVRVVQSDGALAWSSPVWLGGFSRTTQWDIAQK